MDVMLVFDVILVVFGVYMVGAALNMKKTGRIGSIVLTSEEIRVCKNQAGFIAYIYSKEAIFGGVAAVLGGFGILNDFFLSINAYNVVEMILFLGAFVWFQGELQKARTNFV